MASRWRSLAGLPADGILLLIERPMFLARDWSCSRSQLFAVSELVIDGQVQDKVGCPLRDRAVRRAAGQVPDRGVGGQ